MKKTSWEYALQNKDSPDFYKYSGKITFLAGLAGIIMAYLIYNFGPEKTKIFAFIMSGCATFALYFGVKMYVKCEQFAKRKKV